MTGAVAAKHGTDTSHASTAKPRRGAERRSTSARAPNPVWHDVATRSGRGGGATGGPPLVQRMCDACEEEEAHQGVPGLQTKLSIGAADDPWEREADAVAGRVMRMPLDRGRNGLRHDGPRPFAGAPGIQRACAECEEELADGSRVQRKSDGPAAPPPMPASVASTLASPGRGSPLDTGIRSRVEPVLGADLSGVRVHNDAAAHDASRTLQARAFTHRSDIFLARGQSASDTELMAHEATHVVQQGAGRPAPDIQRRIVMRSVTLDMRNFGIFGSLPVGVQENLRPLTDQEVETYVAGIGSSHHDFDDIITGTGEEFGFVEGETYRRGLVTSIVRNLHRVRTDLYFDSYQEFVREVRKRALISLFMRASQGRTRGTRPTGYPGSCGADPGPRVSAAAAGYWIVHPSAAGASYWFELSSAGRRNGYEALRTLIFNHQTSACLRTLMHCDYMISAQQFFVLADTMGATDFNQAVRDGSINLEIRWNSYENIVADTPTGPAAFQSLQSVYLTSENDFIIGDHVIFFNHDAFDDLNEVHWNARGSYSNWRLENAIVTDMDSSGEFRFQGHGYFSPKRRGDFVSAMVRKMNDLVDTARSAIASGHTSYLTFTDDDGHRFEAVRASGRSWTVYYHQGLGTHGSQSILTMPLRHVTASDYPHPFAHPGESRIQVRRPIESRRDSLTPGLTAPGAASPLPSPGTGTAPSTPSPTPTPSPAPAPRAPAPTPPAGTAPTPGPTPAPPTTSGPTPGPAPAPPAAGSGAQQQRQAPQQRPTPPTPVPVPVPTPVPATPCPFVCTGRHFLGARTPYYGRGADFAYYDFPSLSAWEWLRVAPFRLMPDGLLEFGMNNVLGLLAGSDGRAMVRHFRGGTGSMWTHGIGSRLNREATHCPSVNGAVSSVRTQLAAQLRTMRALGHVDCSALSVSPVPTFHFGFSDSTALKAIIGGTQGLEVYLDAMRVTDPATCAYELDLEFVVLDDFGVDTSDLYWPALIKFWILQHERRGNRPFVNRLLVDRSITV